MGKGDTGKSGRGIFNLRVPGQSLAAKKRKHGPLQLDEGHAFLRGRRSLPSQPLIECSACRHVGDAERNDRNAPFK